MATAGWRAYHKALEAVFLLEAEQFSLGLDHNDYLKKCGLLAGFRRAAALPEEIITNFLRQETEADDRAQRRTESTDRARAKLVGTPAYDGAYRPHGYGVEGGR